MIFFSQFSPTSLVPATARGPDSTHTSREEEEEKEEEEDVGLKCL